MRVFFSAVQAGNRSGTGRYAEALVRALADVPGLDLCVEGGPPLAPPVQHCAARPWSRLCGPGGAFDVMHYPANFCPAWGTRNTIVTVHDLSFLRHPEWFRADRAQYYAWAFAITKRRAARFVADSAATRDDLIALADVPAASMLGRAWDTVRLWFK